MSWGRLSKTQREAVRSLVAGNVVHDFGAGDCELALVLVGLGAEKVVAIDKENWPPVSDKRVERVHARFSEFKPHVDVAFLSWPANHPDLDLRLAMQAAAVVVYLGRNTDNSACGWPSLFKDLATRELLAHVPEPPNTLTCYGPRTVVRPWTGEERASIRMFSDEGPLTFERAEELAAGAPLREEWLLPKREVGDRRLAGHPGGTKT